MARPELGSKRQCTNCGAKFYDLDKDPAVCPKCGTVYQAAAPTYAGSGGRSAAAARAPARREEEDEVEPATGGPEIVSLDDVEAEESAPEATGDEEDSEIETTAEDNTFLEEEEEGGDVSDLIDGDIEDEEEG